MLDCFNRRSFFGDCFIVVIFCLSSLAWTAKSVGSDVGLDCEDLPQLWHHLRRGHVTRLPHLPVQFSEDQQIDSILKALFTTLDPHRTLFLQAEVDELSTPKRGKTSGSSSHHSQCRPPVPH